jgi:hypothetical protein
MTMSGNATNQELRYEARMAHTQIAPALRCESVGYERDQFAGVIGEAYSDILSSSFQFRLAYLQ